MTLGTRGERVGPSPLRRWLAPPFTALVFLIHPLVTLCRPGADDLLKDPGTGWHLVLGRYILDTGSVPARDLFSFTAEGRPWIDQSWLFDAAGALLVKLGGLPLFATACMLVSAVLPVLIFRRALRMGAGMAPALALTGLAYLVLDSHATTRPHIVTYLSFALVLEWMDDVQNGRRPVCALWWLPLLALGWANLHGGFVAGLTLVAIFAGVAGLSALGRRDPAELRRAAIFSGVLGAMVLATLGNPQGWRLHESVAGFLALGSVRQLNEFQSPNFLGGSVPVIAFETLALLVIVVAARRGTKLPWPEVALVVFFLHEALHSVRHMNLFVFVAAPIVAREITPHVDALRPALQARWREIAREQAALRSPLLYFPALIVLFLGLALRGALPFPPTLDDLQLSRGAADFIAAHEERFGRPFNTDELGGSLVYRFWPRMRIFVDDRVFLYGDEFFLHEYLLLLHAGQGWREVLDRYDLRAAVVAANAPCATLLKASPEWELAYEDRMNTIFLRHESVHGPCRAGLDGQCADGLTTRPAGSPGVASGGPR